jgi:peptide/nickel transport system substrate-binding protein
MIKGTPQSKHAGHGSNRVVRSQKWEHLVINSFSLSRRNVVLGAAASASLPLWFPKAARSQENGTLKMRSVAEVLVLDPAFRQSESELWVSDAVLPKLINFKAGTAWEWELYCAESVEQVDPVTVTFRLKKGLKWTGNYGEVTTEDVKYSFERYKDAKLAAPNAPTWEPLDRVEIIDQYSGVIHLKQPYAGLFGYVLPHDGGQIVCKRAVEEAGGRFGAEAPATSGPYSIVSIRPGEGVELKRDPNWTGTTPSFERIELIPIVDSKAAENAIRSGDLDFGEISISAVPRLREAMPDGYDMDVRPTNNFFWFCANMSNPDLQNTSVRRALQMAIDRKALVEGAFSGIVEPSYSAAPNGMPGYVDKPFVEYDPDGARALIEEAGATGLTLNLEVTAETDQITAAQIIQANLATIGVQVNINQHEAGAFWSIPAILGQKLQLYLRTELQVPPDVTWALQWLLPEQAGVWNWQYFVDDEFKKLYIEATKELNAEKRNVILRKVQERLDLSYSALILLHLPRIILYNNKRVVPAMKPDGNYRLEAFTKP